MCLIFPFLQILHQLVSWFFKASEARFSVELIPWDDPVTQIENIRDKVYFCDCGTVAW